MTGQPVASEPRAPSTDLDHEDEVLDEHCAITVPFIRDTDECICPEVILKKEPLGCKDCFLVRAISERKSQAISQTKKRWAWFSEARTLDETLSTRLGTLGYLPWEIRDKIFRHVLDDYMTEGLTDQIYKPTFRPENLHPSALQCLEMKKRSRDEFDVVTTGDHETPDGKLYSIFSLRSRFNPPKKHADHRGPDFVMPLRLATADTKFEFDRIFLSTMIFRFSCHELLHQFLNELSVTQLSQVRSITIQIYGCNTCLVKGTEPIYNNWGSACFQLPSTLDSINFDLSNQTKVWNENGGFCASFRLPRDPMIVKGAKEAMEFFRSQVRRIALEAEVTMVKPLDANLTMVKPAGKVAKPSTLLDTLDAMVSETDKWSKEAAEFEWRVGAAHLQLSRLYHGLDKSPFRQLPYRGADIGYKPPGQQPFMRQPFM